MQGGRDSFWLGPHREAQHHINEECPPALALGMAGGLVKARAPLIFRCFEGKPR
jgi:hypothetical protein